MHDATDLSRWAAQQPGIDLVSELRQLWCQGQRPDVDAFLDCRAPLSAQQVVAVLTVDQLLRWQAGERVSAEDYLQRHPALVREPESAIDLVYGEFLLREERGELVNMDEYQQRFPEYADEFKAQVELYRAMMPKTLNTPLPHFPETKRPEQLQAESPIKRVLVPEAGPLRLDSDIRRILRQRLLVIYLICIVGNIILLGGKPFAPDTGLYFAGVELAMLLGLTGHVIYLWRRPALSLHQLRWLELTGFGTVVACFSWFLLGSFQRGLLPRFAGVGSEGMTALADHISGPWFSLLVMYGMFVPNTWRRCAALVGAMAVTPVVLGTVMALADDTIEPAARFAFLFQMTWLMTFAAAIAIYGSHKISTLRQQAFEARQLGQYQLKKRLGVGGMGEVYLAEHVRLRRPCALKIIRPERAGDPKELRRFEREVRATAALTHPNIVQVFDYGHDDDGTFYYAMEYLPGLNLEELIQSVGPLSPERAIHLLRQVCGALQEAHGVGLIHRDIKPSNIIVSQRRGEDVVKLLDFGLVRNLGPGFDETRITQDGDIAGTPAFMSPEQASGNGDADAHSDIYSLGAVAYFLLTGQPPFTGRSAVQALVAHLYEEPAALTDHCPDLPGDLQAAVLRCLAKNPLDRFLDVRSLDASLAACQRAGDGLPRDGLPREGIA